MRQHIKPLLLIPSYNPGPKGIETVLNAQKVFTPILVVTDGSTDGSDRDVELACQTHANLYLIQNPHNEGKGTAVLKGLIWARDHQYTHVLTMDADGQHPVDRINDFIETARRHPDAMILGVPVFDEDAPSIRVKGRRISNWWANLETLWTGIDDSLFGFRVYPIEPLFKIMRSTRWMRRFDFDPEAVVRLRWAGIKAINVPAQVRYPKPSDGGVSHFRYGRDNLLLTGMHLRLLLEFVLRLPLLLLRRVTQKN
jgi:glycosyltransferase involved in cell wall biosynthesis